ncbi:MAG TPA: 4Fe-4S binding protein [Mobilitalea sp.]|nr:4Fe-4S binding protein [Mobilitalea sp.]
MSIINIVKKAIPVLFAKKENCCGCTACYSACPADAINMLPDEEGFLYPFVNQELCTRCGRCQIVCIFKEDQRKMGFIS